MNGLFLTLAAILAPGDAALGVSLTQALEQPAVYLQTHASTADRLGHAQPAAADPALPWLALVDGLIERRLATELDWDTGKDDLIFHLEKLSGYRLLSDGSRASISEFDRDDGATVNWLRDIAAVVEADDTIVAVLDIDSDSYVTLLLKQPDYAHASAIAEQLGFKLLDIREHDPNQF